MTSMEKQVMVRLCAKILKETDLYDSDVEVRGLFKWVCLSEQIKANNNEIRKMTGEYKKVESELRDGINDSLDKMKKLCEVRDNLYEIQNELKNQKLKIEYLFER